MLKIILLDILTFICSVAPLGIFVGINHDRYITTATQTSLSLGVFLAGLFVLIAFKDRLHNILRTQAQLKVSAFLLLLFWGLRAISNDLLIFCLLSLIGSVVALVPNYFLSKLKTEKDQKKQAKLTAEATVEAVSKMTIHKK